MFFSQWLIILSHHQFMRVPILIYKGVGSLFLVVAILIVYNHVLLLL